MPAILLALREGRLPENAGAMRLATFYRSVLPAVWSFMLAARARGLGDGIYHYPPRVRA